MIPNAKRRERAMKLDKISATMARGSFAAESSLYRHHQRQAVLTVGLRRDGVPEMFASMGSRMPIGTLPRLQRSSGAPSNGESSPALADAWCSCRPLTAKTGVRVP
jgi:hypothetical protein